MTLPILNEKQILEALNTQKNPFFADYFAFYSSWFGGITTNPHLMLLPIDDHMVHRGDGIFEAMRADSRSVYMMDEHLQRLFRSAEAISLKPSFDAKQIKEIILETLKVANQNDVLIRVFVSRGPGNFSVNPYDSVGPQLYIAITSLKSLSPEKYTHGVTVGKSQVPAKSSHMAQVKSCNYLPNVLMKKEAVDRNFDFMIGTDEKGNLTEGSTENIMIVDQEGTLIHPQFDSILKGITMTRACELARANGMRSDIRHISIADLLSAKEVIITGTTVNVISVVKYENQLINDGKPGKIAQKLLELIKEDMKSGVRGTSY